jgi:hypothetical protein
MVQRGGQVSFLYTLGPPESYSGVAAAVQADAQPPIRSRSTPWWGRAPDPSEALKSFISSALDSHRHSRSLGGQRSETRRLAGERRARLLSPLRAAAGQRRGAPLRLSLGAHLGGLSPAPDSSTGKIPHAIAGRSRGRAYLLTSSTAISPFAGCAPSCSPTNAMPQSVPLRQAPPTRAAAASTLRRA